MASHRQLHFQVGKYCSNLACNLTGERIAQVAIAIALTVLTIGAIVRCVDYAERYKHLQYYDELTNIA
jgi:hypothetical protein